LQVSHGCNLSNLLNFPQLESLYLVNPTYEEMMTMLGAYGRRLKTFIIEKADMDAIDMWQLLDMCPALVQVTISNTALCSSGVPDKFLNQNTLQSLQTVELLLDE